MMMLFTRSGVIMMMLFTTRSWRDVVVHVVVDVVGAVDVVVVVDGMNNLSRSQGTEFDR